MKQKANLPANLIEPDIAPNSLEVMKKRHLLRDAKGVPVETPKQMFWRVATALAGEDEKYLKGAAARKKRIVERTTHEFYETMARNHFLPGSRVLYEAGNPTDGTGQLSSCFVLPIEDDLEQIFDVMKEAAIVQKNNGGTGFNFSHIRPKGDVVGGTPNVAAGPVHFIKTFSQAFDQVLQGKKRGGGNMAILNINHPDIIEFINLKGTDSTIRNFNISVGVTDSFMEAVREDAEYELINPRTGKATSKLRAREVFDLICQKAWECADPGLFFLDTAQNTNPTKPLGIIEATNPCGEEPLRAYESCNLGSVVMPTHLTEVDGKYELDWELLRKTVRSATHFLDNMIDLSKFPLQKIADQVAATRKLGLGVVGLATMFYRMQVAYNSTTAIKLTEKIIEFIQEEATKESELLAAERGTFPGFAGSKWEEMGRKVRNATMTSIAPTGTLSLVANTSSGIEPVFSLVYAKANFYQDESKEERQSLYYTNAEFEEYAKAHGFYTEELMGKIAANNGTLTGLEEVSEAAKKIFVTTHDISPDWHVRMQAAAQKNVDAAVSKTINLSHDATVSEIRKAYIEAWETKCKGITIYRDGSKEFQVLENVSTTKTEEKKESLIKYKETKELHTLSSNAVQVLEKRALLHNDKGEIVESPNELWRRIARHIASAEKSEKQEEVAEVFYRVMNNGEFYCGGTLLWAGMGKETIMSKCLVLPVEDSIDSIFRTLNWNIQCLRRGVGTGFNFSKIRSSYSVVGTTGERAAGPVEYLRMYNRAQDTIRGRGGRGLGSMAILNVEHPDIEEFIECKDDLSAISHYNISVGISDKFMSAVKNDEEWQLTDPHDKKVYKTVRARDLFERIAKHAWQSGDPGMYFLDTAERGNNTPALGTMDATNPCGEQPLIPFETCNMGHINLSRMVMGFPFAEDPAFIHTSLEEKMKFINFERISQVTKIATRFLDNIIDVNNYPITEIEEMTRKTRNIGVGVMGYADLLVKLGISYGSSEANELARKLMEFIQTAGHNASAELGQEKGNFPAFELSNWAREGKTHMRNVRVTTIAPTGTISIIGNCNPGIEPIFALGYRRKNSMGNTDQEVIDPLFEEVARKRGFYSAELMHSIAEGAHLHDIQSEYGIPDDVVEIFKTTHEIAPDVHVQTQAAFQEFIDSAVSKTINLPNSATWQDIARVYQQAYELNCKGITIFRDGSKDPALQVGTKSKTQAPAVSVQAATPVVVSKPILIEPVVTMSAQTAKPTIEPRKRSDQLVGITYKVKTGEGSLFITINEDDKGIAEVFLNMGKSGSFTSGYISAIGRLISTSLRSGISVDSIIDQLQGIRTSTPTMNKGMIIYSVPDAVAKILKRHIENSKQQMTLLPEVSNQQAAPQAEVKAMEPELPMAAVTATPQPVQVATPPQVDTSKAEVIYEKMEKVIAHSAPVKSVSTSVQVEDGEKAKYTKNNVMGDLLECPDCAGDLEYAEGCILCRSCGFSKCG